MKNNNKYKKTNKTINKKICPICGDTMHVFEYAYDQNQ